mmetsp:Transcript_38980/g.91976  ORF Transcript_38980/g.91976 Transcript_38980/m.91976 type:complete len:237 (+) Transcript_38980:101-811(+)|eukprot:3941507-Rhodomonas_salina.2
MLQIKTSARPLSSGSRGHGGEEALESAREVAVGALEVSRGGSGACVVLCGARDVPQHLRDAVQLIIVERRPRLSAQAFHGLGVVFRERHVHVAPEVDAHRAFGMARLLPAFGRLGDHKRLQVLDAAHQAKVIRDLLVLLLEVDAHPLASAMRTFAEGLWLEEAVELGVAQMPPSPIDARQIDSKRAPLGLGGIDELEDDQIGFASTAEDVYAVHRFRHLAVRIFHKIVMPNYVLRN